MNRYEKDARIEHAFDGRTHSGTLVIADTEPQVMRKACKHINLYRERVQKGLCILVEDEADAMYRTPDRRQKFEQAHMKLQDHMCAVSFMFYLSLRFFAYTIFIIDKTLIIFMYMQGHSSLSHPTSTHD